MPPYAHQLARQTASSRSDNCLNVSAQHRPRCYHRSATTGNRAGVCIRTSFPESSPDTVDGGGAVDWDLTGWMPDEVYGLIFREGGWRSLVNDGIGIFWQVRRVWCLRGSKACCACLYLGENAAISRCLSAKVTLSYRFGDEDVLSLWRTLAPVVGLNP